MLPGLLTFMGPAVLIPLQDPLLTLLDTICIGHCSGTLQLAAMGPATTLINFSVNSCQSLQVATLS